MYIVIEEEVKEKALMSSPTEKEEHIVELLNQWEMELNFLEDWLDNPEPKYGLQEMVMPEEETYHSEEELEEARDVPEEELT